MARYAENLSLAGAIVYPDIAVLIEVFGGCRSAQGYGNGGGANSNRRLDSQVHVMEGLGDGGLAEIARTSYGLTRLGIAEHPAIGRHRPCPQGAAHYIRGTIELFLPPPQLYVAWETHVISPFPGAVPESSLRRMP